MAKVIDFNKSPIKKLKAELEQKDKEIEHLKNLVKDAHMKLGMFVSVNELLKLQLTDMITHISMTQNNLGSLALNVSKLKSKLPDLSQLKLPKVNGISTDLEAIHVSTDKPDDD